MNKFLNDFQLILTGEEQASLSMMDMNNYRNSVFARSTDAKALMERSYRTRNSHDRVFAPAIATLQHGMLNAIEAVGEFDTVSVSLGNGYKLTVSKE